MMHLRKTVPSAIVMALMIQLVCFGATIRPNDDVTIRNGTNYDAYSPFGLFVKNSGDVSYMEYTLGSVSATEAKLVLHNNDVGVSNTWTIIVKGSEYSFDETTFNTTFAGSGWPQVGTIPGVMAIAFYEMDLTTWYNNNLGKTMSLFMTRNAQPGGSGPIFEDKEGTKTGDALLYGPRLEVTAAPAKATIPNPPNGADPIHPDPILSWTAAGGALSHDVYFDTTDPPAFQINQGDVTYEPGLLDYDTTYYWRIDEVTTGGTITGDVWNFTTAVAGDLNLDDDVDRGDLFSLLDYWLNSGCGSGDHWCQWRDIDFSYFVDGIDYAVLAANWWYGVPDPPGQASNLNPADTATNVSITSGLRWTAGADSHDVYFGTSNPPAFQNNQTGATYDPGIMSEYTTYYWRIDEINSCCTTTGTVWSFTTGKAPGIHDIVFPGTAWQTKSPAELGLNSAKLDQFATNVGGVGCIVRQGYVVKTWGTQGSKADWASAAKPVISTMLFFAVEENKLTDVHELIEDYGWNLITKDEPMEFYHLANMTSGYARGEAPGAAWAYNDYAIKLYAKTLFDNVYGTTPNTAATNANRLGDLQFEDGSIFSSRSGYGLSTSVRDFARIGWLWCNYGYWGGKQLLPRWYFDDYMKAHVSSGLPRTTTGGSDYLGVGTYGGGSDQTADGPGIYGFNWWCNPNQSNWPDAPADTVQANGHWGQEVVTVIPSLSLVVACRGSMGSHTAGNSGSAMNQNLKLLVEACPEFPLGQIMVDDANPDRMVYHATYEDGREKPVCFAGPGDPEDFFYNDTTNNLNLLIDRGARCTYITAVLQDTGGGNPGTGSALDAKLDEWEGYITQLEDAGIVTVFFFFDDTQPLTANWEELVDKCVARFKHHKLLIWSVAEEYSEALSAAQVSLVAARIKQQDNYNHVVGVHQLSGSSFDFLADSNIDMFLMQLNYSTPDDLHNQVKNSNANGTKILNMAEASDHAKQTQETVRKWNWASIMGGASAVQVLWMGRASDPAAWNEVGKYDDCARLMDFMESTRLNETSTHDELARGNTDYVLANPGQVYIAYGDSGSSLGLNVLAGTYREKWYDPVDGDWVDQGSQVLSAGDQTFTKPGAIGSEAALYLEVESGEITPNDDCTTRGSTNYNNSPPEFGLLVKNADDVSWIEFDFGGTPVSQALLTLFQADGAVINDWEIVVRGAEYSFDETTFTGTDVSTWTVAGTIPGVRADNQYHTLDITSFYNDNLGKTITLQLGRDVQPGGNGPMFGDKEGTRPDADPSQGPKISIN